jgi:hypothetical protein
VIHDFTVSWNCVTSQSRIMLQETGITLFDVGHVGFPGELFIHDNDIGFGVKCEHNLDHNPFLGQSLGFYLL